MDEDINWLTQNKRKVSLRSSLYIFFNDAESSVAASIYSWLNILLLLLTVFWGGIQTQPTWDNQVAVWKVIEYIACSRICFDATVRSLISRSIRELFTNPTLIIAYLNVVPCVLYFAGVYKSNDTLYFIWLLRLPLRLVLLAKEMEYFELVATVVLTSLDALALPMFLLIAYVTCFACLLFWVERGSGVFYDIPVSMYFAIVTIGTVGYGDLYPKTWWGRVISMFFMITGVFYTAIPLSIIGNNFAKVWLDRDRLMIVRVAKRRVRDLGVTRQEMRRVFDFFDKDRSGDLGVKEFRKMIDVLGLGLNERDGNRLFRAFDTDRQGTVSYAEFFSAIFEPNASLPRRVTLSAPRGVNAAEVRRKTTELLDSLLAPIESRLAQLAVLN